MSKKCVILRGPSGIGKSTFAKKLGYVIHSTDNFFGEGDDYNFNPSLLGEYHSRNLTEFIFDVGEGCFDVIVDNTNINHWEWQNYALIADMCGYIIHVVDFTPINVGDLVRRNIHGVPLIAINKMVGSFKSSEDICIKEDYHHHTVKDNNHEDVIKEIRETW